MVERENNLFSVRVKTRIFCFDQASGLEGLRPGREDDPAEAGGEKDSFYSDTI